MLNSEVISIFTALSIALLVAGPLAWKWQLGLSRCIFFVVVCTCSFGAITPFLLPHAALGKVAQVIATVFMTMAASLAVLLFRFYRDPERVTTQAEGAIVSPADGRIIYIYRSERSVLPVSTKNGRQYTLHELTRTPLQHEDSVVVGIAMNYLDVHVNRAPVSGSIVLCRRFPGRFGSLRDPAMAFENERATTVIRTGEMEVAVVQIASRLVRQIVSYVKPGQTVLAGERIGAIRLGSQVDVVIPARPDLQLHAKVGDHVVAGESIIGVFSATTAVARDLCSPIEEEPIGRPMRIIQIEPEDSRWTDFIRSQPGAFVYHHPLWTAVIQKAYGHRNAALAAEAPDKRIVGVLPLMRTWGVSTGVRFASLPHTPVAGPLAATPEIASELIAGAVQLAASTPRAGLQLKTLLALPATGASLKTVAWESTFTLQIPAPGEEIRFGDSRHHQRVLWAVRHGERLGCHVKEAQSVAELRQWYQLYLHTMQLKVVPPRPFCFFLAAWNVLRPPGLMRLLLARDKSNEIIAGACLFAFGETVFYAFNGRRENQLSLRPNDLLQWRAIHDAQTAGHRFYDFGEVEAGDDGLADFKRKWGARPHQLWRHYYPAQREPERNPLLRNDAIQRLLSATWRSLPVKATGVLGGWIYSYL